MLEPCRCSVCSFLKTMLLLSPVIPSSPRHSTRANNRESPLYRSRRTIEALEDAETEKKRDIEAVCVFAKAPIDHQTRVNNDDFRYSTPSRFRVLVEQQVEHTLKGRPSTFDARTPGQRDTLFGRAYCRRTSMTDVSSSSFAFFSCATFMRTCRWRSVHGGQSHHLQCKGKHLALFMAGLKTGAVAAFDGRKWPILSH